MGSKAEELTMSTSFPPQMLNVILASTVLPLEYRTNVYGISERVLTDESVDYFSIISGADRQRRSNRFYFR